MSVGLIALLDDIAAIAKVAAASLDDVASQAAKAGVKAAGVVIDDTAVTPGYVIGFAARRELPIVGKIAAGSLAQQAADPASRGARAQLLPARGDHAAADVRRRLPLLRRGRKSCSKPSCRITRTRMRPSSAPWR